MLAVESSWAEKGQHEKAIADYSEAIRLDPKDASSCSNRGVSWAKKGQQDKAIADYSEAIRLDPNDVRTYVRRARARIESREYDQGIADFDKAIELDPKSAHQLQRPGDRLGYEEGIQQGHRRL